MQLHLHQVRLHDLKIKKITARLNQFIRSEEDPRVDVRPERVAKPASVQKIEKVFVP